MHSSSVALAVILTCGQDASSFRNGTSHTINWKQWTVCSNVFVSQLGICILCISSTWPVAHDELLVDSSDICFFDAIVRIFSDNTDLGHTSLSPSQSSYSKPLEHSLGLRLSPTNKKKVNMERIVSLMPHYESPKRNSGIMNRHSEIITRSPLSQSHATARIAHSHVSAP